VIKKLFKTGFSLLLALIMLFSFTAGCELVGEEVENGEEEMEEED